MPEPTPNPSRYMTSQGLPVLRKLTPAEERSLSAYLGCRGGGPTVCYVDHRMEMHLEKNCLRSDIPEEFLQPLPAPFDPTADRVNRNPAPFNPGTTLDRLPDLNAEDDRKPEFELVPEQEISQLLPVMSRKVGEDEVHAVNARDLHRFLGVKSRFDDWIKNRIKDFEFTEHKDFEVFLNSQENPQGGRPPRDYALTMDMAKELAMVERTPRGKQARLYFIEVEKSWRSQQEAPGVRRILSPSEMFLAQAQLNVDHERQIQMLSDQNRTLALKQVQTDARIDRLSATVTQPMIDVYSGLALAGDNVSMMWVCKRLGIKRLVLFEHLRMRKVLMTGGSKHNYPYSAWEHCFATTTVPVNKGERMATATKVTPEGIKWLCRCYHRGEFDAFLNRPRRAQLDLSRTPGDDDVQALDL